MINNYPYYPYQQQYQQIQQQPMQIQNGGLVSVRGIEEARNYPVAPGNSVTFKDETSPYVYTKTQGFSQLDRPVFEKYRLVKEEDVSIQVDKPEYALKTDITSLKAEMEEIRKKLSAFSSGLSEGDSNE
jgi:hypothetical protein